MKQQIKVEPLELEEIHGDNSSSTGNHSPANDNMICEMINTNISSDTDAVLCIKSEVVHPSDKYFLETYSEKIENIDEEDDKLFVHQFIDAEGRIWNDEENSFLNSSDNPVRLLKRRPIVNGEYVLSEQAEQDFFNADSDFPSNDDDDDGILLDSGDGPLIGENTPDNFMYPRRKRRRSTGDFCFYCMARVLNFSRHMQRHHKNERDVKKILALPAGNKLRKQLFGALRKQGNYLICKTVIKPVKSGNRFTSHLPCINCFGFYSRKNLYRHLKRCTGNTNINTAHAQVDAQNFLVGDIPVDSALKEKVFSRMRADDISLIAKQDVLICAYAAEYLNTHQGDHCINIASRKMRDMGKLLQELQELEPSIKNLFMALRPKNFDLLIEATKNITGCELEDGNGSFASSMGNALKQCCEEALSYRWKEDNQDKIILVEDINELNILMVLLETQWKQAFSNLIHTDLRKTKLNKVTLISLAENIRIITDHLIEIANISIATLETNHNDVYAYLTSLETVFCRLILLNRRSFEELQTIPLELYKSTSDISREKQEEVDRLLAKSEKVTMNKFKRIIIQGKKGNVPVLFSVDIQKHLDILLKYRENIVPKSNQYLFGIPPVSQPIMGYKVFRKYTSSAGIENPSFFTYTKLKKYIATLSQLFTINETDIEQLASFLGLVLGVHISRNKLENDLSYKTTMSKLLILMEEDRTASIWGKNVKDIIDLNEDLLSQKIDKTRERLFKNLKEQTRSASSLQRVGEKAKKWVRIRWSSKQKEAVETFFSRHIEEKRPPRKSDCVRLKALYPELLQNKDWLKIKVYIQNKYTKKPDNKVDSI